VIVTASVIGWHTIRDWSIANSGKAEEKKRIYYSRDIDDEKIVTMIEDLPISEITP
jgi:hypothetical protein